MNICSIYKITNQTNNKVYVGQTWMSIKQRFAIHKATHSRRHSCVKLSNAIMKYGDIQFSIGLITVCSTQEVADYWERYFISQYDSIVKGYNISEGGSNGKHSEETKRKIGAIHKGKIVSSETRLKMSKANIGKSHPHSEETKRKMSVTRKGGHFSVEHKKRLSEAQKERRLREKTENHRSLFFQRDE